MTTKNSSEAVETPPSRGPFQLFMLGLSLYVLFALAAQTFVKLDEQTRRVLEIADVGVCLLFLLDFVNSLARASNRLKYMVTWGWLDLISSIPTIDTLRWARAARVVRIVRVVRGVRAARLLSSFVLEKRAQSGLWTATLVAILAIIFSSIAILHLEDVAGANITVAEDAIWWSFVTVTTVGYGDLFPVTGSGRLVAVGLMLVGIGMFGTLTAYVASFFLEPQEEDQEAELAAIRAELSRLSNALELRDKARPQ